MIRGSLSWSRRWTLACVLLAGASNVVARAAWPDAVEQIVYPSAADGSEQPAMFYAPASSGPKPLLVALHTWSSDFRQPESAEYAKWCIEHGWIFIHPDSRGPNVRPEATGSELAVQDVLSAVDFAKRRADVDTRRIYLVGFSGGGHLALLMAGRAPKLWAGVSVWVPIFDLQSWYAETAKTDAGYAEQIAASCGGVPARGTGAARECRKRSPSAYLARADDVPIDINAGIEDGHTGPVPVSHSIHAFNALAARRDRVADDDIDYVVTNMAVPAHLQRDEPYAPYGEQRVLFRRESRRVRLTLFDGGHEKHAGVALEWLAKQVKDGRKARAAR